MTIISTDNSYRLNATLWSRRPWSKALGLAPRSQGGAWRTRAFGLEVITVVGFAAYLSLPLRLAADTIYVSNYGDSTVTRIAADGQKQTYASGLRLPYGLAFDARGSLLCAGSQTNQIYSIATNGMVRAYGSGLKYANLTGLAFDASGNLYAADQYNNVVVRVLAGGKTTNFATGLNIPWGIAFDAAGYLYIANAGLVGNAISKVAPDGTRTSLGGMFSHPYGLAFDAGGNLLVSESSGAIWRLSPQGTKTLLASVPGGAGELAFDSAGSLYVVSGATIVRIASDGAKTNLVSGLNQPLFIAVEPDYGPPKLSVPSQTAQDLQQNGCRMNLFGGLLLFYQVEASPDLVNWTPWRTQQIVAAQSAVVSDTGVTNIPRQFYRARPGAVGTGPLQAFTAPATGVSDSNAVLRALVNPNGKPATVWFEWGTSPDLTNATGTASLGSGIGLVPVGLPVNWSTGGQPCFYRVAASNSLGVVRGGVQMCGLGRTVVVWGDNYYGQTNMPAGLSNVVAVAGGNLHSLALRSDGKVVAWGYNQYGQTNVPPALDKVAAVAGGTYHSLALRNDGTVVAWGQNTSGQTTVPAGLGGVVAVAAGGSHSLALQSDGTVVAWGNNYYGQAMPADLGGVVAIAAGGSHSLGLRSDGKVVAWGSNTNGQTAVPASLSNVVAIAAGNTHSLALRNDGTVAGWGTTTVPNGLSNVVAISAGGSHSLALRSDGRVVAWGNNSYGQATVPTVVSNVVAITGGGNHSLVSARNRAPSGTALKAYAVRGMDQVVTLGGTDPEGDALQFRITSLPATGTLYQYENGNRGAIISAPGTVVTDAGGRVIYVPPDAGSGQLALTFEFTAEDGEYESSTAQAVINLDVPPQVFADRPTQVTTSNAVLQAMVDPHLLSTAAWFEWGATPSLGQVSAVTNLETRLGMTWLRLPVTGLAAWEPFFYRVVASNRLGVAESAVRMAGLGRTVVAWSGSRFYNYGQTNVPAGLSNVVAVAARNYNSLALRDNGTVAAWGYNPSGVNDPTEGLSNVVAIACGYVYNLALRENRTVAAWGVGDTNTPAGLSNVVAVACGDGHALALRDDGTVAAWGANDYGETNVPPGLDNVVAVAGGSSFSVALRSDGTVAVWGYYGYGLTNVPAELSNVVAVAAGSAHCLALRSDGTVAAWGDNYYGQTAVPPGLSNVVEIAAGSYHSLALRNDGTCVAWGDNSYGQTNQPAGLTFVVDLAAGETHTLVSVENRAPSATPQTVYAARGLDRIVTLTGADPENDPLLFTISALPATGELYQYSGGTRGALITTAGETVSDPGGRVVFAPPTTGSGPLTLTFQFVVSNGQYVSSPATVQINLDVPPQVFTYPASQITASGALLQAVVNPLWLPTAVWFEWGLTSDLGLRSAVTNVNGGESPLRVGLPVVGLAAWQPFFYRVVASNNLGVVRGPVQMGGLGTSVVAWGDNSYGQTNVPAGLSNVVAVAGGSTHSAALRNDGTVAAWGENSSGQTNVPPGLSNVVALAVGYRHNLALRDNGTIVAWGYNYYGQTNVPPDLANVVAIAAGGNHSLALRNDGTVAAWGNNASGQTNVPADLVNVVAVAAGSSHSLALRSDGTVAAWGLNQDGQTSVPADLSNAVAIAGGSHHSLALRADGRVMAWGWNSYGQTIVPTGLTNVVAIAAGDAHSLALRSDGAVVVWGSDSYGQTNTPAGLTSVVALAAGWNHNLAVNAGGMANPLIESLHRETDGQRTLTIQSQRGRPCDVLGSTNFQQWTLLTTLTNAGGRMLWTDPAAGEAPRYYRLRQMP
jgi:alpha-tubulin suppressor-like RCC1 family protein